MNDDEAKILVDIIRKSRQIQDSEKHVEKDCAAKLKHLRGKRDYFKNRDLINRLRTTLKLYSEQEILFNKLIQQLALEEQQ